MSNTGSGNNGQFLAVDESAEVRIAREIARDKARAKLSAAIQNASDSQSFAARLLAWLRGF